MSAFMTTISQKEPLDDWRRGGGNRYELTCNFDFSIVWHDDYWTGFRRRARVCTRRRWRFGRLVRLGRDGLTIAMTKVYNQGTSYSMIAIPMFVLMANFLTHFQGGRWTVLLHPLSAGATKRRLGTCGHRGFHDLCSDHWHRRRIRRHHGHAVCSHLAEI